MAADKQDKQQDKGKGDKKDAPTKADKVAADKAEKKAQFLESQESHEVLIRIAGYDIPGSKQLYPGLTRIKGVSWVMSNATCLKLGFPRTKRISELSKDEIKQIEQFISHPDIADFQKNRRSDVETGETRHFIGTDLDMKKDLDIRRMKKIRSYKGVRHTAGQPVRGQRTRSHFRKRGGAVGVKRKAK